MATFIVQHVKEIDAGWLEREAVETPPDKPFAVVRVSEATGRAKLWSWHKSRSLALAAKRRWTSREVRTP